MREIDYMENLGFSAVALEGVDCSEIMRYGPNPMGQVYEATIQQLVITIRPGDWGWKAYGGGDFHETCYLGNAAKTLIIRLIDKGLLVGDKDLLHKLALYDYDRR